MPLRILVVDDEPDVITLFRQRFRREIRDGEYQIDFALSAQEALEALQVKAPPPDMLILSDINMPGKSGLELLAEIKTQWPSLTVFIITAYGDRETERRAFELGAAAFLPKPIDFYNLRLRLRAQYSGGA
jgi:CheY-like chemotaxis protein